MDEGAFYHNKAMEVRRNGDSVRFKADASLYESWAESGDKRIEIAFGNQSDFLRLSQSECCKI